MPCEPHVMPDGTRALFCGRASKREPPCRDCDRESVYLCDHPIGRQGRTCSAPLCPAHAYETPGELADRHLCPTHAEHGMRPAEVGTLEDARDELVHEVTEAMANPREPVPPRPAQPSFLTPASGATFTPDGLHRLTLMRRWGPAAPPLVVIGLNPSTADADHDDPTLRRVREFAKRDGRGSLVMLNLFTLRATDPRDLRIRPFRERSIPWAEMRALYAPIFASAGRIVCAWGAIRPDEEPRAEAVERLALEADRGLWCLGRTNAGQPRHPLYLRATAPFESYPK